MAVRQAGIRFLNVALASLCAVNAASPVAADARQAAQCLSSAEGCLLRYAAQPAPAVYDLVLNLAGGLGSGDQGASSFVGQGTGVQTLMLAGAGENQLGVVLSISDFEGAYRLTMGADTVQQPLEPPTGPASLEFLMDQRGQRTSSDDQYVQLLLPVLPDQPVRAGDSWTATGSMAVNLPGQPGRRGAIPLLDELNLDLSYVVAPPEPDATGELVVIHYTGSLSGAPPQVAGLPLSTRSNVSGIIQFDVARGIVVAGESRAATSIALRLGGIAIETTLNAGTSLRLRPLAR